MEPPPEAPPPETAVRPAVQGGRDPVELVANGTGDLRSREHYHQADDGRDQDVLDKSLPTEAGRLRSDPPEAKMPLHAYTAPFAQGLQYEPSVEQLQVIALVLPQRRR